MQARVFDSRVQPAHFVEKHEEPLPVSTFTTTWAAISAAGARNYIEKGLTSPTPDAIFDSVPAGITRGNLVSCYRSFFLSWS
jgi:hypothetical protein